MRQGWKQWADDGFPYLDAANRDKYKFTAWGQDELLSATWEEVFDYLARGMIAIARHYSGEEGADRLRADGYPEEMIAILEFLKSRWSRASREYQWWITSTYPTPTPKAQGQGDALRGQFFQIRPRPKRRTLPRRFPVHLRGADRLPGRGFCFGSPRRTRPQQQR